MEQLNEFSEARKERAKELLATSEPTMISEDTFLVPSQSHNTEYIVKLSDFYTCNCPDFLQRCKHRGLYCKHIQAVLLMKRLSRRLNRAQWGGGAQC